MLDAPTATAQAPYKVDVGRGQRLGELSKQWFSRPDDQKCLSLDEMFAKTAHRRDSSFEEVIAAGNLRVVGSEEDATTMQCITPGGNAVFPSHFAFGQLCQLGNAGSATGVFRGQPSWLAAVNVAYQLSAHCREEPIKVYGGNQSEPLLRAATGPNYGRIFDADVVAMVQKIAGNGTGDTRWKVPGLINWGNMTYNPYVDVTTETTTLYASDRDMYLFLCDDTHPIEIGKLPNGDPDLIFRGFIVENSEVGDGKFRICSFWLRGVCQNRNLWGVEDFQELSIVHSKHGATRFAREATPALERYADASPTKLLAGISAAKIAKVASTDDERKKFLTADSLGFSMKRAMQIIETCEREEGRKPETIWDMTQGITAFARTMPNTDDRLTMERLGSKLMGRAARQAHLD